MNNELRIYESNMLYYMIRNGENQLNNNILSNNFEYKINIKKFDLILYSLITLISFTKNLIIIEEFKKLQKNINCYGENYYMLISLLLIYIIHALFILYLFIININFLKNYHLKNKFLNKIKNIITKIMILNIIIFTNIAFIIIGYNLKCLVSINEVELLLGLHLLEFIFI